ncbi:hypothetical protein ABPG72_001255 [Tetrahymena utriculariae]
MISNQSQKSKDHILFSLRKSSLQPLSKLPLTPIKTPQTFNDQDDDQQNIPVEQYQSLQIKQSTSKVKGQKSIQRMDKRPLVDTQNELNLNKYVQDIEEMPFACDMSSSNVNKKTFIKTKKKKFSEEKEKDDRTCPNNVLTESILEKYYVTQIKGNSQEEDNSTQKEKITQQISNTAFDSDFETDEEIDLQKTLYQSIKSFVKREDKDNKTECIQFCQDQGTDGSISEVDESVFKSKYHRGRQYSSQWVFGLCERNKGWERSIFLPIANRK